MFCLNVCLCIMCMQCSRKPEEGIRFTGLDITDSCEQTAMWVLAIEPWPSARKTYSYAFPLNIISFGVVRRFTCTETMESHLSPWVALGITSKLTENNKLLATCTYLTTYSVYRQLHFYNVRFECSFNIGYKLSLFLSKIQNINALLKRRVENIPNLSEIDNLCLSLSICGRLWIFSTLCFKRAHGGGE